MLAIQSGLVVVVFVGWLVGWGFLRDTVAGNTMETKEKRNKENKAKNLCASSAFRS